MTYETKTLEPAWASWLTDEQNLEYKLNPQPIPENITPWNGWDPNCNTGSVYGEAATQENILKLHHVAGKQTISANIEDATTTYTSPSLELFQEMIWDRTEGLGMTDDEVQDLAIWAGHKFLCFSLGELADSWGITKDAVRAVVRRFDRRANKPQGSVDIQKACLVAAISL